MPVFFVAMPSPHSAIGHVSLAITSCDIVTAHLVRVRVVVMVMMMMMMVVAVMMIARLVMLNVVKHLYK